MAVKTIKNVKRVSARDPKNNEYVKADNIRVSRAGKICLETFKKRKDPDGTVTILTKRIYKKPTKTNIDHVRDAGYSVDVLWGD